MGHHRGMTYSDLIALILFLAPLAYSPGPGNMFFAGLGARFGLRASIPASLGYHLATWGVTAAIGFGMSAALQIAPETAGPLRWLGAGYVLWLAFLMARAEALDDVQDVCPAGWQAGALLLFLNPKAYVIIAMMFSQFLKPGDPVWHMMAITTVFTLNNLVAFTLWTVVGDRLARLLRRPEQARRLNMGFAALLAAVALWLLIG